MRFLLASAFSLCLVLGLAFGRPGQESRVRIEPVAGAVSVLYGEGGNIGLSKGADGLLMIDDQFERLSEDIAGALEEHVGEDAGADPRFLINTHHHGDHTGGNAVFGKLALVLAHDNVRARLLEEGSPAPALPVVTYAQGLSLHWNGEEVRVLHVPGAHTDGDSVVWFTGSNVVHLGDLYFQVGYPFIDVANGGNVLGLLEGLQGLVAELPEDVRLIPGHGVVTGKAELLEYLEMLDTITSRVRTHLEAGDDEQAILAAEVTKDFDERWGNFSFVPPARFVQSVIASLR